MKANNYDIKANAYLNGVGMLTEIGEYAGEYMQEAYDILEIEGELEEDEWCDICYNDKGEIYAVGGDTTADSFGNFFFKKVSDGVCAEGKLIDKIGKSIATYHVYYKGTDCVDYSIDFIEIPNGSIYTWNHNEGDAYISSRNEIEEAKEEYEGGYWA